MLGRQYVWRWMWRAHAGVKNNSSELPPPPRRTNYRWGRPPLSLFAPPAPGDPRRAISFKNGGRCYTFPRRRLSQRCARCTPGPRRSGPWGATILWTCTPGVLPVPSPLPTTPDPDPPPNFSSLSSVDSPRVSSCALRPTFALIISLSECLSREKPGKCPGHTGTASNRRRMLVPGKGEEDPHGGIAPTAMRPWNPAGLCDLAFRDSASPPGPGLCTEKAPVGHIA
jgi:hypothetical protein